MGTRQTFCHFVDWVFWIVVRFKRQKHQNTKNTTAFWKKIHRKNRILAKLNQQQKPNGTEHFSMNHPIHFEEEYSSVLLIYFITYSGYIYAWYNRDNCLRKERDYVFSHDGNCYQFGLHFWSRALILKATFTNQKSAAPLKHFKFLYEFKFQNFIQCVSARNSEKIRNRSFFLTVLACVSSGSEFQPRREAHGVWVFCWDKTGRFLN